MNIKAIICFALLLGFHNRVVGSTNVTLVSLYTNSVTLNVNTGQTARIVFIAPLFNCSGCGETLVINSMGGSITYASYAQPNPAFLPVIVGPASITLTAGGFASYLSAFCTIELSNPADSFLPSNAVVIPADSGGPVNIILESSADLINWYPSLPGAYGANYTNRFFRVRAQRSQ
jgi:hypothetical protein